jgi:hypothetical protein
MIIQEEQKHIISSKIDPDEQSSQYRRDEIGGKLRLTGRPADAEHAPRLTGVCGSRRLDGSPAFWSAVRRG